jgi:glycosyltransferase involved in cell wall biosynthesis
MYIYVYIYLYIYLYIYIYIQHKLASQGTKCDHIIHTAVNSDVFNPNKKSASKRSELTFGDTRKGVFLCVYVGRISKEKKIGVIVDAVKSLGDKAYLAIIGDGPSAPAFAAMHGRENRYRHIYV